MKKMLIYAFSATLLGSTAMATVECDCNVVYSVTRTYEVNLPVTRVSGYFQVDASARCESEVKKAVNSWLIKPKVYSSRITNCISTRPVVTE